MRVFVSDQRGKALNQLFLVSESNLAPSETYAGVNHCATKLRVVVSDGQVRWRFAPLREPVVGSTVDNFFIVASVGRDQSDVLQAGGDVN